MKRASVGVDPGGRFTGVVRLNGDGSIAEAKVLKRQGGEELPSIAYLVLVLEEIEAQVTAAGVWDGDGPLLSVEGVNPPTPHLGMTNVAGIMGVAMIFFGIMSRWPEAIAVPPMGNGSGPALAYPEQIRKYARLGGPSDHARSAYDVAIAGERIARRENRERSE